MTTRKVHVHLKRIGTICPSTTGNKNFNARTLARNKNLVSHRELFYYVLMLPQIIWSELYCVTTPFKAPTMKTLKKKII